MTKAQASLSLCRGEAGGFLNKVQGLDFPREILLGFGDTMEVGRAPLLESDPTVQEFGREGDDTRLVPRQFGPLLRHTGVEVFP